MKKQIYLSAAIGLIEEFIAIVSGLILPRMILLYFGSDYNGILSAVTQFIGCISLFKSGIGMATKAALYKPLYYNDTDKISGIMAATMEFLHKVALIFIIGVIIFAGIYPFMIHSNFSWLFTASLVLIVSLSTFFQYYFGLGYQLLLTADQKNYIVSVVAIINTVLNTIVTIVCLRVGMNIHMVKLLSSVVYCSTPIILYFYVGKKYTINTKAKPDRKSISKKWDAFGMQIANFVNNNTDIIVASIFLELTEVSVYTVYYLAINGVKKILNRVTVGVEAALGKSFVENDSEIIKERFFKFEFILNFICIISFSCLIILIVPFVLIYTRGITDVEYKRYLFSIIACLAEMLYCIRLSYTFIVQAKGMFAETKKYYYIEAIINILISVVFVQFFGLTGIVLGTLAAMIYRTVMFALYVYHKVINVHFIVFIKRMLVTFCTLAVNCILGKIIIGQFDLTNYYKWILFAVIVCIETLVITSVSSLCFYPSLSRNSLKMIFGKFKNKSI